MRVVKVVYNNNTKFILDILKNIKGNFIAEYFNLDKRKEQKSARVIQTELGSKNSPLVAILDENLELVGAVWPENNPDWEKEITHKINNL